VEVDADLEAEAYDRDVDATALRDRMDGVDLRIAPSDADMLVEDVYSVGELTEHKISYRHFDPVKRVYYISKYIYLPK
jgi:hypothetical protein